MCVCVCVCVPIVSPAQRMCPAVVRNGEPLSGLWPPATSFVLHSSSSSRSPYGNQLRRSCMIIDSFSHTCILLLHVNSGIWFFFFPVLLFFTWYKPSHRFVGRSLLLLNLVCPFGKTMSSHMSQLIWHESQSLFL